MKIIYFFRIIYKLIILSSAVDVFDFHFAIERSDMVVSLCISHSSRSIASKQVYYPEFLKRILFCLRTLLFCVILAHQICVL